MTRIMLIDAAEQEETRVVITEDGDIDHFDFISKSKEQVKGNIYLAKITRIEPSLQAAFVEYGGDKQGFLSFSEVHPDYYQIPVEDREQLLREAQEAESDEEDDDSSSDENEEHEKRGRDRRRKTETRKRSRRKHLRPRNTTEAADDAAPEDEADSDAASTSEAQEAQNEEASPENNVEEKGDDKPIALEQDQEIIASEPVDDSAEEVDESGEDIADTSDESESAESKTKRRRRPAKRRTSRKKQQEEEQESTSEESDADDTDHDRDDVDTVANSYDDSEEEVRKPAVPITRRYKIQEVLRPGQIMLVQVIKEERGNKGVSLSSYISLAGSYCVLMPNSPKGGGISRKIGSSDDRKRLKSIAQELKSARGMSAIIRTAGIDRTNAEIKRDYEYLIKLWNQVREDALNSIAPALVYEESDIVKRSIRDHYNGDIDTIFVQGEAAYRRAKDFMKLLMPSHAPRVKQVKEAEPIFTTHNIEPMLSELYRNTAPLKSGGYLVINPTEALISIDVNSGRSTTEKNVEETAYKTNLEACDEVARQLRLRNLGGLVVIDFIDMGYHKYRRNVERALKEAFKKDRAKIQIGHISMFGLLEMSRQRMGASIVESTTEQCPHCNGTGRVTMASSTVMQLLRNLQSFASEHGAGSITIQASQPLMLCLLNEHRAALDMIEQMYDVTLICELHQLEDHNSYQFRGKQSMRFSSKDGFNRKRRGGNDNASRSQNRRGRKQKQEKAEKPSASAKPQETAKKEVTKGDTAEETQEHEASSEQTQPKEKPKRRGGRGSKKAQTEKAKVADDQEEHQPSATDHASDDMPAKESVKAEEVKETDPSEPVVTELMTIQQQEAPTSLEPQDDTPPSKQKRKGWWQRVLDG